MKLTFTHILLLLAFCISFPGALQATTVPRRGVTGEQCRHSEYCQGGRSCVKQGDPFEQVPCQGLDDCICFPRSPQTCASSHDCEAREVCTRVPEAQELFCISAVIVGYTPELIEMVGAKPRPQVSDSSGLSFYPCINETTCKGERRCLSESESSTPQLCNNGELCACHPTIPQVCTSSDICTLGEVCAIAGPFQLCISADVVAAMSDLVPTEPIPGVPRPSFETSPRPQTSAVPPPRDDPTTSPHEREPSESFERPPPSHSVRPSLSQTIAQPSPSAEASATTQFTPSPSETQALVSATPNPSATYVPAEQSPSVSSTPQVTSSSHSVTSPSPSASSSVSSSSNKGCVDSRALSHFSKEELVFAEHRVARVLCDQNGSCATAGHMVMWEGAAMMMQTYCKVEGGCREEQMLVNSPRMAVKLRVRSKTEGLQYTAFAARFATGTEEMFLRALVRVGL